jgi:hypothetical protein
MFSKIKKKKLEFNFLWKLLLNMNRKEPNNHRKTDIEHRIHAKYFSLCPRIRQK